MPVGANPTSQKYAYDALRKKREEDSECIGGSTLKRTITFISQELEPLISSKFTTVKNDVTNIASVYISFSAHLQLVQYRFQVPCK